MNKSFTQIGLLLRSPVRFFLFDQKRWFSFLIVLFRKKSQKKINHRFAQISRHYHKNLDEERIYMLAWIWIVLYIFIYQAMVQTLNVIYGRNWKCNCHTKNVSHKNIFCMWCSMYTEHRINQWILVRIKKNCHWCVRTSKVRIFFFYSCTSS